MKIYAPNKHANGIYASVMFVNGVGETDDPKLISWFRSHGYKLSGNYTTTTETTETTTIDTPTSIEEVDEVEKPEKEKSFEDMTPNELREWMMENGFGSKIRNTRSKEKLLEILKG